MLSLIQGVIFFWDPKNPTTLNSASLHPEFARPKGLGSDFYDIIVHKIGTFK